MKCGDCRKFQEGRTCYSDRGYILRSNCSKIDRPCDEYDEDDWKIRMEKTRYAVQGG